MDKYLHPSEMNKCDYLSMPEFQLIYIGNLLLECGPIMPWKFSSKILTIDTP